MRAGFATGVSLCGLAYGSSILQLLPFEHAMWGSMMQGFASIRVPGLYYVALLMALSAVLGAASAARAQSADELNGRMDTLFGSHAPFQPFFDALQKAVAADDRQAVAAMVDYPFRTRIDGKAVTIKDAAGFVASYDRIITARVRRAVADQSYATLFANWQGVSIGDGEIWFSMVGGTKAVRITAINH